MKRYCQCLSKPRDQSERMMPLLLGRPGILSQKLSAPTVLEENTVEPLENPLWPRARLEFLMNVAAIFPSCLPFNWLRVIE